MELQAGTSLQNGRYRVERVLGQGGFGITYLGVQIYLSRKVAIKEFFMEDFCLRNSAQYVTAPTDTNKGLVDSFRRKFIKEAQNIAKLKHPNIVSIIDVFEDNGTAYYVMESLDGGSLANKVSQGALPEHVALRYIRQVASALEYIHSNNMMHLDIKPANILLDGNDNAVVIDFGLSKQYDDTGQQTSTTPVGISHGYAPIEQYSKNGVGTFSPSTDIYSLGATLYKLLTGATPPEANRIYDEGLPPLPAHITQNTRIAIETAMQPRRKDRPQSIAAFLQLLQSGASVPPCKDVTSSSSFNDGDGGVTMPHSTADVMRSISQPKNNPSPWVEVKKQDGWHATARSLQAKLPKSLGAEMLNFTITSIKITGETTCTVSYKIDMTKKEMDSDTDTFNSIKETVRKLTMSFDQDFKNTPTVTGNLYDVNGKLVYSVKY